MHSSRPPSRSQNQQRLHPTIPNNAPPRRAKVSTSAQLDIASIASPPKVHSSASSPSPSVFARSTTPSTTSHPTTASTPPRATKSHSNSNIHAIYTSSSSTLSPHRASSTLSTTSHTSTHSLTRPAVKLRTSGSVVTLASMKNSGREGGRKSPVPVRHPPSSPIHPTTNTTATNTASGTGGPSRIKPGGPRTSQQHGGSVSSDDGTASEDSTEDIQLFSGGNSSALGGFGLAFGARAGRATSSVSASKPPQQPLTLQRPVGAGPKMAGSTARSRTMTSNAVGGGGGGAMTTTTSTNTMTAGTASSISATSKPMRIAAGASIKAESMPAAGSGVGAPALSTSVSSSTSSSSSSLSSWTSSSHLGTTSPGGSVNHRFGNGSAGSRMGEDGTGGAGGPVVSIASAMSSSSVQQQQPTSPSTSTPQPSLHPLQAATPTSPTLTRSISKVATHSAVAANKLAEESRRQEEAARTKRKIADLEISNASLLSINASLEATIRKQAAEMHELKTRVQSAQYGDLGFPSSTMEGDEGRIIPPGGAMAPEAVVMLEVQRQDDVIFKRLCLSIEQMIFEAKQALDQSTRSSGVKVLSSFDMYEKEAALEAAAAVGEDEELDSANQSMVLLEDMDSTHTSIQHDLHPLDRPPHQEMQDLSSSSLTPLLPDSLTLNQSSPPTPETP